MGRRRRAQKKVSTKKRATVSKTFKCPFCSMENSVSCVINVEKSTADLKCRVCAAKYQTVSVNYLTEPVDVYYEWLDNTQEANQEHDVKSDEDSDEDE